MFAPLIGWRRCQQICPRFARSSPLSLRLRVCHIRQPCRIAIFTMFAPFIGWRRCQQICPRFARSSSLSLRLRVCHIRPLRRIAIFTVPKTGVRLSSPLFFLYHPRQMSTKTFSSGAKRRLFKKPPRPFTVPSPRGWRSPSARVSRRPSPCSPRRWLCFYSCSSPAGRSKPPIRQRIP